MKLSTACIKRLKEIPPFNFLIHSSNARTFAIWVILAVVSCGGSAYQVAKVVYRFTNEPTTTVVSTESKAGLFYPPAYLCVRLVGDNFTMSESEALSLIEDWTAEELTSFNLTTESAWLVVQIHKFITCFVRTGDAGYCFQLKPDSTIEKVMMALRDKEINLEALFAHLKSQICQQMKFYWNYDRARNGRNDVFLVKKEVKDCDGLTQFTSIPYMHNPWSVSTDLDKHICILVLQENITILGQPESEVLVLGFMLPFVKSSISNDENYGDFEIKETRNSYSIMLGDFPFPQLPFWNTDHYGLDPEIKQLTRIPTGVIQIKIEVVNHKYMSRSDRQCHPEGNQTEAKCRMLCRAKALENICNCTSVLHLESTESQTDLPLCDMQSLQLCSAKLRDLQNFQENCEQSCIPSCQTITYIPYVASQKARSSKEYSWVNIRYTATMTEVYMEKKTFTLENFFGDIGGILGIWLAASWLSFIQLLCLMVTEFCNCFNRQV